MWALLWEEAFIPDRLVVVTHAPHKRVAYDAAATLRTVLGAQRITTDPEVVVVPEADFADAHEKLRHLLKDAKTQGEVALNITPARKSLAVVAMVAGWDAGVDHIYYLYLKDMRGADRPYPLIARDLQELIDLKELRPA